MLCRLFDCTPLCQKCRSSGDWTTTFACWYVSGAQYSEANFAKSNKDFIDKIEGSLQELEETAYWLDLLKDAGLAKVEIIGPLYKETRELFAIFVTIVKRVKSR